MQLVSERLVYTKIMRQDITNYKRWYMNDEVMKYITGRGLTEQEAETRFEKVMAINEKHAEMGFYLVKLKTDSTFIGIAKFTYFNDNLDKAEVGYGLLPEFWGNKYAPEMLRCLITHAYKMARIKELVALVDSQNSASKKILTDQLFTWYKTASENNSDVEYYKLSINR